MAKLRATRAILYQNRLYSAGDELPQYDASLVSAWLEAGSAKAEKDTDTTKAAAKTKAETTSGKAKTAASTKTTAKKGQK